MSKKIKEQELEKLQGLVQGLNKIVTDLGVLETQKHSLLHSFDAADAALSEFKVEMNESYGDASINISTGEIDDKDQELRARLDD
tara:strand:+ start:308 stop:562 length:255 start_codon:yes stop_codon:yes gene_type:complete